MTSTIDKPWTRAGLALGLALCLSVAARSQVRSEVEPNDRRDSAQDIRFGERVEGSFQADRDVDFYRIVVEGTGKTLVQFDLSAVPGVQETLSLEDAKGNTIWSVNGAGPLSIFHIPLDPGTYLVSARGNKASGGAKYILTAKVLGAWSEEWEVEPNSQIPLATPIRLGQTVKGHFQEGDRVDVYKLAVDRSGLIDLELQPVPGVRTTLDILDARGNTLWNVQFSDGAGTETLKSFGVRPGDYHIRLRGASLDNANAYTLGTRYLGPVPENHEAEPNEKKEDANEIKLNVPFAARVNLADDSDSFLLRVPAPGPDILHIVVSGLEGVRGSIELHGPDGKFHKHSVLNVTGREEELVWLRPGPGVYHLRLKCVEAKTRGAEYAIYAGKSRKTPASPDEVLKALRKALDWLAAAQRKDGSWEGPEVGSTGLALMSFLGGTCVPQDYDAPIQGALRYLKSVYRPSASYPSGSKEAATLGGRFGRGTMYEQAIATLALIEALIELDDSGLEPLVEDALALIIRSQNTEQKPEILRGPIPATDRNHGGWRYEPNSNDSDLSITGWQVLTLRAARNAGFEVPERVFQTAADFVRSLKGPDGSFNYQSRGDMNGDSCGRAGMGALSLQLAGAPEDPAIPPALRFMQASGPRWNIEEPGDGYPFYYWYYGTRAMYLAGGEDWRVWKDWMCRLLVDQQSPDGSWTGEQNEKRLNAYRTALGALMLEFCCGHVPIYMTPRERTGPGLVSVEYDEGVDREAGDNIELILDASNSMWGQIGGEAKITIARRVLTQTVAGLPAMMRVGLRAYGHRFALDDGRACTDTELLIPIGPLDKARLIETIQKIALKGKTPLVLSVLEAIKDLAKTHGGSVILVTDGIESCGGDIQSIGPAVQKAGLELKVHIVGFDIKEQESRAELEAIARSTGGRYLDAKDAGGLLVALEDVLKLEFVLIDEKGTPAARGLVGGEPVKVKGGVYSLRVLLAPRPLEAQVTVKPGGQVRGVLKKDAGAWKLVF